MAAEAPARRPRWGIQTNLFQWRQPALYLFGILMLGGLLFTIVEQTAFRSVSASGWALSWVLLLVYAVPIVFLVYRLDLYEREPLSLVIGAFLWGAMVATTLSSIGNTGWALFIAGHTDPAFAREWVPALTAPWVEEILKASGVILLYLIARGEFDDIMDGFVYGAMVGLGFTIVEDVFYFMRAFGGEPQGVFIGFYIRVIGGGLYGHVLYTGLWGMGIAYFTSRKGERTLGQRLAVAVGLALVAMVAHFVWNSPLLDFFPQPPWTGGEWLQIIGATAVKGLPFLAFLILMLVLARRRENRWLAAALATEVGKEGITASELDALDSRGDRKRARRQMARVGGSRAANLLKLLQRQQINLAMVSTRVEQPDHPDLVRQRQYCAQLRQSIVAIPGAEAALRPGGERT